MPVKARIFSAISVIMLLAAVPTYAGNEVRPTRTPMPAKDHERPTRTPIDTGLRTRKPSAAPTATRTPLALNQRTRKPTEPPPPTRTPLVVEQRPDRATKTPRPTRTPLLQRENPTPITRPTRTPMTTDVRTRKPAPEARPTRTPLVVEQREAKPTKTARATRTPLSTEERTRKPAAEARPTRTPLTLQEQEARATKAPRPTRTAIVKDSNRPQVDLRPTRTAVPTRTSTPVPSFNESKVTASCRAIFKKDVTVILSVTNASGQAISDLTAADLSVQRAPGTGFSLGSAPANFNHLPDGQTATFKWRGEFTTPGGACGFSVSAHAKGPSGQSIDIPLTDCGSVVLSGAAEGDLVPPCLAGGGAGEGGAEGGENCPGVTPPDPAPNTALPDLTIDAGYLANSAVVEERTFSAGSCALVEQCVGGTGVRKLLRFSTRTPNIGAGDLHLGDPRAGGPFVWSACHQHYHFLGYANYRLLGGGGQVVATGHKQAFCLLDLDPNSPNAGPPKYHCLNQGISAGWADIYDRYLDCQWIDITGVPPGSYTLEVSINPTHYIQETNYDNNIARTTVTIP